MKLHFYKYHGAGNDFVLIDNRTQDYKLTTEQIRFLCDRRLGVGGDGLMLLQISDRADFEMVYYNADGYKASMCGNGGRCITAFAKRLGIIDKKASFIGFDGLHTAEIIEWSQNKGVVRLRMKDTSHAHPCLQGAFIDTGSPHYVEFVTSQLKNMDVFTLGRKIRNNKEFEPNGTNVNFVEVQENGIFVRTYERGVEDETLSCGTGVTASALVFAGRNQLQKGAVQISTRGGNFIVYFEETDNGYQNINLQGPVTFVFEAELEVD